MKKLMIAAAIVCAAACSQAAKVDWQLNSTDAIKLQGGGKALSLTVYAFWADATDFNTLKADLASGKANASNIDAKDTEGNYIYSGYVSSGVTGGTNAKRGKMDNVSTGSSTSFIAGKPYDLVFVAFDSNTTGDYYYLSGKASAGAYDGSEEYPTGVAATWSSVSYSASNWHEVASAPEPTSGLLLLLGVAGLALKRKRA